MQSCSCPQPMHPNAGAPSAGADAARSPRGRARPRNRISTHAVYLYRVARASGAVVSPTRPDGASGWCFMPLRRRGPPAATASQRYLVNYDPASGAVPQQPPRLRRRTRGARAHPRRDAEAMGTPHRGASNFNCAVNGRRANNSEGGRRETVTGASESARSHRTLERAPPPIQCTASGYPAARSPRALRMRSAVSRCCAGAPVSDCLSIHARVRVGPA
ncbi:hypothetical protein HYPSUDRAFT_216714 [Hypholoma sublateritium FD-334 SS-4]|uniref:Uncharacterized protein n=1 Tax=Hypholoma sublateritium (strain FD-334 SS-4) TaxID=945553 RepID=A0A0D2MBN5_HYPSF|nr:hypothetical protein HYPSUDRAFT_216714 [Hypholoma sublateritium FD-334 SS-4]